MVFRHCPSDDFLAMVCITMSKETMRKSARSGSMICPVCGLKRVLVEHHLSGRNIPNANASWNRAFLCGACHDEIHAGKILISGWVMTTEGKVLVWRRSGEAQEILEEARPWLYSDGVDSSDCGHPSVPGESPKV